MSDTANPTTAVGTPEIRRPCRRHRDPTASCHCMPNTQLRRLTTGTTRHSQRKCAYADGPNRERFHASRDDHSRTVTSQGSSRSSPRGPSWPMPVMTPAPHVPIVLQCTRVIRIPRRNHLLDVGQQPPRQTAQSTDLSSLPVPSCPPLFLDPNNVTHLLPPPVAQVAQAAPQETAMHICKRHHRSRKWRLSAGKWLSHRQTDRYRNLRPNRLDPGTLHQSAHTCTNRPTRDL